MGEITTGTIIGFLRLDTTAWNAALDEAEAKAKALGASDPDVHVTTNAGEVATELAAADAETKQLGNDTQELGRKSEKSEQQTHLLSTALATLGPAAVPILATAIGGAAAFAGMGAAGVLAIVGIKAEMASGSATGEAYKTVLASAKQAVDELGASAASGVLGPLEQTVRTLLTDTPQLTGQVHSLAGQLGGTVAPVVSGLLTLFMRMDPLMQAVGLSTMEASRSFATWAQNVNVSTFIGYLEKEMPPTITMLGQLTGAVVHLVAAFAPVGSSSVTVIGLLSQAISAIPLPVLQVLVTLGVTAYSTFRLWNLSALAVQGLGRALVQMGASLDVAASGMVALQAVSGFLIGGLALLAISMSLFGHSSSDATADVRQFTDSLNQQTGAVTASTRELVVNALMSSGALSSAKGFGLSLQDVTDAAMGNQDALGRVNAALAVYKDRYDAAAKTGDVTAANAMKGQAQQAETLSAAIGAVNNTLKDSQTQWSLTSGANEAATSALAAQAAQLGTTTTALQAAKDAQAKTAAQSASAAVQMQLESNAAGILKNALDLLNGKTLGYEQAQNSFNLSLLNAQKQIVDTRGSLKDMTLAGEQNKSTIDSLIQAAEQAAQAYGDQTGSSEKARQKAIELKDQLIDQLSAWGGNREAVTKYVDKLFQIPKSIPPTKVDLDDAQAKAQLAWLTTTRTVTLKIHAQASNMQATLADLHQANGGIVHFANGGISPAGSVVRRYASGGLEDHIAQIGVPGATPRVWLEPETGGEAYIPLSPAKRATSVPVLAAANAALGNPLGAVGAGPVQLVGTLDSPWGPVQVQGQIQTALAGQARTQRRFARAGA